MEHDAEHRDLRSRELWADRATLTAIADLRKPASSRLGGMAGWALAAIVAVGVGMSTASMVERPSTAQNLSPSAMAGQNVAPISTFGGDITNVDTSITTAGTRSSAPLASGTESIRLAMSSMQRQINALSARNDRLEAKLLAMSTDRSTPMTTGSVPSTDMPQGAIASATSALQNLAAVERQQTNSGVSTGLTAIRQQNQQISGVDLGSAISFEALRARWLKIRASGPAGLEGMEARAVLRDGADGLIAHLIVGPLSSQNAASKLCVEIGKASEATDAPQCQPVPFEGQPL
ncbi:MAG: hypothetical protein AAGH82_07550 [Pseudomonadota bacterium]